MRTWILALIFFVIPATLVSSASAVECLDPSPEKLPIWQDFESFVEKEYYQGRKGGGGRRYAFGHALGRLASAVQSQPDRHQAFECVKLVLEQKISHLVLLGQPEAARVLFSTVMETALGMHNEKVKEATGVTSREPLYHLFGGKIQNPTTSTQSPRTVVKTQPGKPKKKSGSIIKSQPGVLPPVPSGGGRTRSASSTTPQCIKGANWSLEVADRAIVDAWNLRTLNSISDCKTGDNWATCRDIMNNLSIARDHIFQTFDQNHDGKNDCKIGCRFDTVAVRAKALISWEDWLWKRHFSAAAGLSTIYYTINERRGIPMCGQKPGNGSTMAAGGSASGSGSGSSTASVGGSHVCNDPGVPTSARWKFYRYIYGGGGTSYPEKEGLICYTSTSYYTYAGGGLKHYICDDGMVNCRRSDKKEYIYTDIISRDTGTEYQYKDQGGYAVRSSKSGAPEETTIIMGGGESVETDETMQAGINLRGSDLKSFLLDQAQPGLCQDACEKNERCQAWTYVKPGVQGSKAKCWLKHSVPEPQKDSCCVSGVTAAALNDAANALVAAKVCSNANIDTGKEWAFPGGIALVSRYYQHSGHLCEKGGERVMKVAGKKLIGFTCLGGWKGCKRNISYDADLIYPGVDYQWGKRAFLKLKMKWRGMNEGELYIEK